MLFLRVHSPYGIKGVASGLPPLAFSNSPLYIRELCSLFDYRYAKSNSPLIKIIRSMNRNFGS